MSVEISVEYDGWSTVDLQMLAGKSLAAVLHDQDVDTAWEITVLACDDARISELNAEFREKSKPTNVLSWPAFELASDVAGAHPDKPPERSDFENSLGDIAISFETCQSEAKAGNIPFDNHVIHLLIHSCLHLLGYDHETAQDAALMESLETKILESMGIADPYYDSTDEGTLTG